MIICIMSRGRAGKVETTKWIPQKWRGKTYIVVPPSEFEAYIRARVHPWEYGIETQPDHVTNYSQKFKLLTYEAFPGEKKIVICDDDLYFNEYIDERLCVIKDPERLATMFDMMEKMLDKIALVGVHPRMMAQTARTPFEWNSKIVTIQGINRELVPPNLPLDRFPILADVVLNCSLLARGIPTARITTHFVDWLPSQSAGGCDYRTADMQRDATAWIAKEFGPYAKQVIKRPKAAKWLGDERYDLNVRWKDLYNDAPLSKAPPPVLD